MRRTIKKQKISAENLTLTMVWEVEVSWQPSPAQGHSAGENETRDLGGPRCLCSERQGRNHTQLNLDKHQTQILNAFLLLCDYCVTKCTCTFQPVKLNSSSHLCQNSRSSFSSFVLKMFWKVARVTDKKTFHSLFWVCGRDAEPPVCVVGVSAKADLCWENHTRVSRKTHSSHSFT